MGGTETSLGKPTIASLINQSITKESSVSDLEASIALAKEQYSLMMSNLSGMVEERPELTNDMIATVRLPQSILNIINEDDNDSVVGDDIRHASEIKVSDWMTAQISDQWEKQMYGHNVVERVESDQFQ